MFKIKWEVYNTDTNRVVSRHVFRWAANHFRRRLSMALPNFTYVVRSYKEQETHGNN